MPRRRSPHLPHYRVGGAADGPWLVMLHGASQDSRLFAAQQAAFGARYRLLLIDLPGHGGSSHLPGPYGLAEHARGVRAVLDDVAIDSAHFWGTHTGAGVGLLLAAQGGARLRSLVLESPVLPGFDMPYVATAIARAQATLHADGVAAARRQWFAEAAWFDIIRRHPVECRADAHWGMIADFAGGPWMPGPPPEPVEPVRERLGAITVPVLLVNGEHDVADFIAVADALEAALPRVEREIVADAGGFPLWEFPEPVNARVARFLGAVERQTGVR